MKTFQVFNQTYSIKHHKVEHYEKNLFLKIKNKLKTFQIFKQIFVL